MKEEELLKYATLMKAMVRLQYHTAKHIEPYWIIWPDEKLWPGEPARIDWAPWRDEEEKAQKRRTIQAVARDPRVNAQAIAMVSETWMVQAPLGGEKLGDLSLHPDRREFVMVFVETRAMHAAWTAEVFRERPLDMESPVARLGDWSDLPGFTGDVVTFRDKPGA